MGSIGSRIETFAADVGELVQTHADTRAIDLRPFRGKAVAKVAAFALEVFEYTVTDQQKQVIKLYCENRFSAIKSGVGLGKTDVVAVILLYHVYVVRGVVVSLAASDRQVKELLWGAVRRLWAQSGLPGEMYQQALVLGGVTVAIGFVTTEQSKLRGWHHERLLVLVDESQGVPAWTWESITALVTGEQNQVVAIGNPGPPVGPWYNLFQNPAWARLTLNAIDHPNIREGREIIPGGPSRAWLEHIRKEYGESSPYYRSVVLGEFAQEVGDSLILREWIDRAIARWQDGSLEGEARRPAARRVAALDVARFGPDSNCLTWREGPIVREIALWRQCDTMTTLDRTLGHLVKWCMRIWPYYPAEPGGSINPWEMQGTRTGPDPNEPLLAYGPLQEGRLIVDSIGVGSGIVDRARQRRLFVDEFMASQMPDPADQARFMNARVAIAWRLRRNLEDGKLALPPHEGMINELLAVRYFENAGGKLQLEPKEETKSRIGHSPDIFDSLTMVAQDVGRSGPSSQRMPLR